MAYYRYSYQQELRGITALNTKSLKGQLAAFKNSKYRYPLCCNENLTDEAWWALANLKKLSSDEVSELFHRSLSRDKIDRALREKRLTPLGQLLTENALTGDEVRTLLRSNRYSSTILSSLAITPFIEEQELRIVLREVGDWYWAQGLALHPNISDTVIAELILKAPVSRQRWGYYLLDQVFTARKSLPGLILDAILAGEVNWTRGVTSQMLHMIALSRNLDTDAWVKYKEFFGEKPKFSNQRYRSLVSLVGNPNTALEGVAWAQDLVERFLPKLNLSDRELTEVILKARSHAKSAVTGDWDSVLPAGQAVTLKALANDGLFSGHIRKRVDDPDDYAPDMEAETEPKDVLAQLPSRTEWQKVTQWRVDAQAAVGFIDTQMDAAPEGSWDAFFVLAESWEGTIGDLVAAASTL